jgi:hypothetical protein
MTPLSALWLPIVLSAVIVFVASSIMHMLLPYHRSDYEKLPDEDRVLAALRSAGLKRGLYVFPFTTHKDMKSPAVVEKYNQGPVGMLTVFHSGTAGHAKVPGSMVRLLSFGRLLRRLPDSAHGRAGRLLFARFSCRGDGRISRLRPGKSEQQHLERADLEHDHQGSSRRTRLCSADCGNLRLAMAALALLKRIRFL